MTQSRIVLTIVMLLVAAGLTSAQEMGGMKMEKKKAAKEKEITVKGEVVDISCYLAQGVKATGADHKGCAEACMKAGGPVGILTKDGKLYISVMPDDHSAGPSALLADHMADQVTATGFVRSKHGVNGLMITKVEAATPTEGAKEGK